jgi:Ni,Fe-hydrogenase maturation factor
MDLATTLAFGASAGYPMPRRVDLLVAEATDLETISECLTAEVQAAVPEALREVVEWVAPGRRER